MRSAAGSVLRYTRRSFRVIALPLATCAAPAAAQEEARSGEGQDIVITGERLPGSAIGDVKPLAVLDAAAIHALGATTMKELLERLRPLAAAGGGGEPFLLLNGRRISGWAELQDLPPEAMERTEALPREEAVRFGFPPSATVLNFITKKRLRAISTQQAAGTSTEGGGATNYAEAASVRLDGRRRLSLQASWFHQNPVVQADRDIVPDPAYLFATGGNVVAAAGGSIDPALDALAGQAVTVAALPGDPAARRTLPAYLAGANMPAVTDPAATRWLVPRSDQIRTSGTIAGPLGAKIDGSLNLSMEALASDGLNGPAPVLLRVPGGSGALPFASDTLVYRYLPGALLGQRNTRLNLHAGGTINGSLARWQWTVTGSFDRARARARAEQGILDDPLHAAVAAGGDPLAPVDTATLATRRIQRSQTLTRTGAIKATAVGPVATLPAGPVQMTVAADYTRSHSDGTQAGLPEARLDLTRTIHSATVTAVVPIADPDRDVLAFAGRLGANATVGLADVSAFGRLLTTNATLNWAPARPVQVNLSINRTQTAPAIELLTNPILTVPNILFFDFTTGASVVVNSISGGNPALAAERRQVVTTGVAVTPIRGRNLRLGIDYVATRSDNQAIYPGGLTPALAAAFPGAFQRDPAGRLTAVDFRPVNAAREEDRLLRIVTSLATPIGPKPPAPTPAPGVSAKDALPPAPPRPRPFIYTQMTTTLRLSDRLTLVPGLPSIDLLDGATVTGIGGRPRWEVEGNLNVSYGPSSTGIFARVQGPTRIRSDIAAADLRFSRRSFLVLWQSLDIEKLVARPWTKRLSMQLTIENLLNDRIDVRDRDGATPARFQSAVLDPVGRSVRIGLRKLF